MSEREKTDNVTSIDRARRGLSDTVDKTRQVMGEQLGTARERLRDAADQVGDRFGEVSASARRTGEQLRQRADQARTVAREQVATRAEQMRDGYSRLQDRAGHASDELSDFVRHSPGKAVLIAVGAGFLLGLLLRQRER